jgi:Raf kinase inhibitor-like YbhB/YbcL family protein
MVKIPQPKILGLIGVVLVLGGGLLMWWITKNQASTRFTLTSAAITNNQPLAAKYTCDDLDLFPPLEFQNVPADTKSFAILMEDTTAKNEHPVQVMMWNIPVDQPKVTEGIRPRGTIARNYKSNFNYNGPCPAESETHTYIIHAYALQSELLTINSTADRTAFDDALHGKVLKEATLKTSYTRSKK